MKRDDRFDYKYEVHLFDKQDKPKIGTEPRYLESVEPAKRKNDHFCKDCSNFYGGCHCSKYPPFMKINAESGEICDNYDKLN